MTCPMNVGRNLAIILRVIDALQTVDARDVATPPDNWLPASAMTILTAAKAV